MSASEYTVPEPIGVRDLYEGKANVANLLNPTTLDAEEVDTLRSIDDKQPFDPSQRQLYAPSATTITESGPAPSRLQRLTESGTSESNDAASARQFMNLSLSDIARNTSDTTNTVLNELVALPAFDAQRVVDIFTTGDRLIYIGLLVVLVTAVIMLIRLVE